LSSKHSFVQNRLVISLQIFESLARSAHLQRASFVLFLNKRDLFEELIKVQSLNMTFDDYQGNVQLFTTTTSLRAGDGTYDNVIEFITSKFMAPLRRRKEVRV
jgi:hypothetical protein